MNSILYIVLAFAGFFIFLQLFTGISTRLKRGKSIGGMKGALGREIDSGGKVLVYFYSNTCAACRPMTPLIEKLNEEFRNIYMINISSDIDTARLFGVMGTPATVVVEAGKISNYVLGAKNYNYLRSLLQ